MLNAQNFTDSSDDNDNTAAAAAMVKSESENKVEINPYWSKMKTDKLQEIRKPVKIWFSDMDSIPDLGSSEITSNEKTSESGKLTTFPMEILLDKTDSMPDLESVPESEVSSESVISVFTPANSLCTENSEIGNIEEIMELFNKETIELVIDEGEDALTSFDATMLVNIQGNVEGMQTELYDSGASHHMSPYRDHFKNYISIVPKSITAADKQYFQATGKGNL